MESMLDDVRHGSVSGLNEDAEGGSSGSGGGIANLSPLKKP